MSAEDDYYAALLPHRLSRHKNTLAHLWPVRRQIRQWDEQLSVRRRIRQWDEELSVRRRIRQ